MFNLKETKTKLQSKLADGLKSTAEFISGENKVEEPVKKLNAEAQKEFESLLSGFGIKPKDKSLDDNTMDELSKIAEDMSKYYDSHQEQSKKLQEKLNKTLTDAKSKISTIIVKSGKADIKFSK